MAQLTTVQVPADGRERLTRDGYDWLYFVATDWSFQDAEDVVQETLTRAMEAWSRIGRWTLDQQRAWLKKVALRSLIDVKRKEVTAERNLTHASEASRPDVPSQPHETIADLEARANSAKLFKKLSKQDRVLFRAWALQNCRQISCADAAKLVRMKPTEYRAAKRRLERTVRAAAQELHLGLADVIGDPATTTDETYLYEGSYDHADDE